MRGKVKKKRRNFSRKLRYDREKRKQKKIAEDRIVSLFEMADDVFEKDKTLAKRYVALARRISMKYNSRIPSSLKRKFCRKCGSYLKQGRNVTVRLHGSRLIYHCHDCGSITRFGYKSKSRMKTA